MIALWPAGSVQAAPSTPPPVAVSVTEPPPDPVGSVSVRVSVDARSRAERNVALTVRAAVGVTVHVDAVPALLHAPSPQPPNVLPASGVAVSVTAESLAKVPAQVPLVAPPETRQPIPAGVDATVPLPVPLATVTAS